MTRIFGTVLFVTHTILSIELQGPASLITQLVVMLILLIKHGLFFYTGFPARNFTEQQQNWADNCARWATHWEKRAPGCSCDWRRTGWAASLLPRGLRSCGTLPQETYPPSCVYIYICLYLFGLLLFCKCENEERHCSEAYIAFWKSCG